MKRFLLISALTLAPALGAAQGVPPGPPDSARAEQLRAEIERRFAERVRADLQLTEDQAAKLRATHERFGARRRDLMRRQMEHRMGLMRQMQPGVAANTDSVRVHMDALQRGRADLFRLEQDEDQEMSGYLTPVQRARYQMMRQRFLERVEQLRGERRGGGMRPGMAPGGRPGMRGRGGPPPAGRPGREGQRPPRQPPGR